MKTKKPRATSIVPITQKHGKGEVTFTGLFAEEETPLPPFDEMWRVANEAKAAGKHVDMTTWTVVDPDTPEKALERAEELANRVVAIDEATEYARRDADELRRLVRRIRKKGTYSFLAGMQLGALSLKVEMRLVEPLALEGLHATLNRKRGGDSHKKSERFMRKKLREWNKKIAGYPSISQGLAMERISKATYYKYQKAVKK